MGLETDTTVHKHFLLFFDDGTESFEVFIRTLQCGAKIAPIPRSTRLSYVHCISEKKIVSGPVAGQEEEKKTGNIWNIIAYQL